MQYSLIQRIFVVESYVKKKLYEKWFPDESVPSMSASHQIPNKCRQD